VRRGYALLEKRSSEEVLEEDFETESNKYQATKGLDFVFEEMSEFFADRGTEAGQQKCYDANHTDSNGKRNSQKRERHSDGEGVDAGGDG
jgi:uncharacterized protein (DUF2164 family)